MELAKKYGHKVLTGTGWSGTTVYTVKSHSVKNLYHLLFISQGRIICDCTAHREGRICSHAAAVRMFLIEQREALKSIEAREEQERTDSAQAEITERLLASLTPEEREHREKMDAKMALYGYTWNEAEYRYEYTETVEERNAKGQIAARIAANKAMYAAERAEEQSMAARAEKAMLATDERPFSILK